MFIKLDNKTYVETPIFYGKEWFLDCREEPTLTVHVYRDPMDKTLKARMRKILRTAGIAAKLVEEESYRGTSPFPPNFIGLKKSASVRIDFLPLPVPADTLCHGDTIVSDRPVGQEVWNECN